MIKIYLTKKTNKGNVSKDESFITDLKMVTRHNNPSDTFKIYMEKKKKGESVSWKRGILIEHFAGKTEKEIKDHVINELEVMKEKLKDTVEISWRVELRNFQNSQI